MGLKPRYICIYTDSICPMVMGKIMVGRKANFVRGNKNPAISQENERTHTQRRCMYSYSDNFQQPVDKFAHFHAPYTNVMIWFRIHVEEDLFQ